VQANGDGRGKRKAEETPFAETSKKARIGELSTYIIHRFANVESKEQPPLPLKRYAHKVSLQTLSLTFLHEQGS